MISFKEFCAQTLNESPEGIMGNWDGNPLTFVGKEFQQATLEKRYDVLDTIGGFRYCLKKTKDVFLVVSSDNLVVAQLKMSDFNLNVVGDEGKQTNMVKTDEDFRRNKFAKTMYNMLIDEGFTLVCDYEQYDGARALWKSLGKREGIHKYLYNEVKDTLTEYKNFEDDSKIWSFGNSSKRYILMVVSKSKLNTVPKY